MIYTTAPQRSPQKTRPRIEPVVLAGVLATIGHTPLVRFDNIYCKLEHMNPGGSIKDRVALAIIEDAEASGQLQPGDIIVEASSGNTGISLAMVGAVKGYGVIIVMPENMSEERRVILGALGADVILTSKEGNLKEAIATAERIGAQPGYFLSRQFSNPANIKAQECMAKEVLDELGPVDAVVAGVGTGGTLMGLGRVMKRANPNVKVIAVEPEESPALSSGSVPKVHDHLIQGIGDGFIPDLVDTGLVDQVVTVSSEAAIGMTKNLWRKYGLLAGISSGANMIAAYLASLNYDKVVTVIPDRAERYLSLRLTDL